MQTPPPIQNSQTPQPLTDTNPSIKEYLKWLMFGLLIPIVAGIIMGIIVYLTGNVNKSLMLWGVVLICFSSFGVIMAGSGVSGYMDKKIFRLAQPFICGLLTLIFPLTVSIFISLTGLNLESPYDNIITSYITPGFVITFILSAAVFWSKGGNRK